MSNAEIAARLLSLAQLLSTQKENPYKVKAYRRAAQGIESLGESIDELVRAEADLTTYSGIGKGIASAIREIVLSGTSQQLESLRSQVSPEIAAISEYPRLDPARVLRIYKKLGIGSVEALRERMDGGEIARQFGARMEQHVRQALTERTEVLLDDADEIAAAVSEFLLTRCSVGRAEVAGDCRRRVEVISELSFLIETKDFPAVVTKLQRYGGGTELLEANARAALFRLSAGILLKIERTTAARWGSSLIRATGASAHVAKLKLKPAREEREAYRNLGLDFIEPELREGSNEIELAATGSLPVLITREDIRGELHAHSTSSDGAHTIEQMARAAHALGYEYTGITDHSQSLKIANGVSTADLRKQLRFIDKLNAKSKSIRILKSSEVDILADGSLDYPDDLLKELDYTVCSIHSKFALGKTEQTERILRAMDNRYFNILGHATGRLLLRRPGYEIDIDRVLQHARKNGCYVEINSSPDRLDLSSENARLARKAGVKIAINTDAHATREFDYIRCGTDQARRAGLTKRDVLNALTWQELQPLFRR